MLLLGIDADPIIAYAQSPLVVLAQEIDVDHRRFRILRNVRQRFLHDAIERNRLFGRRLLVGIGTIGETRTPRAFRKFLALPAQRGTDAQVVQIK